MSRCGAVRRSPSFRGATEIEISGTVIDDGPGPVVCLTELAESEPPRCGGAIVDGLALGAWARAMDGTRWGERTMTISWPPAEGHVEMIGEAEFRGYSQPARPLATLPAECEAIEKFVPGEQLTAWRAAHLGQAHVVYRTEPDGASVLRVTGDLDEVRAELRLGDAEPCLEQVEQSYRDLEEARQPIREVYDEIYPLGAGVGSMYNQVDIGVRVADRATIGKILDVVDDPESIRVTG